MTSSDRAAFVASHSKQEVAKALAETPTQDLLEMGQREVAALGAYSIRLTKEERIDGKWIGPQTLELEIRESPLALKGSVTNGPAKGRKLLYNEQLKPGQLRVREAGLLGMAGAVWISVDSPLARRDTKHAITEVCYGALFRILAADFEKAAAAGGHARTELGFDSDGSYKIRFVAPSSARGLYAKEATLGFDAARGLLTKIEAADEKGPFERIRIELTGHGLKRGDSDFTPAAAGL